MSVIEEPRPSQKVGYKRPLILGRELYKTKIANDNIAIEALKLYVTKNNDTRSIEKQNIHNKSRAHSRSFKFQNSK